MKKEWKLSLSKLEGIGCIEHKVTKELCIATKSAELWEYDQNRMACVIYTTITAKKVAKKLKLDPSTLDMNKGKVEHIFVFNKKDLPEVLKSVNYRNNRKSMLKHMESR